MSLYLVAGYTCRDGYSDNEKKSFYSIPEIYIAVPFVERPSTRDDSKKTGNFQRGVGYSSMSTMSVDSKFFKEELEEKFLNEFKGYPILMELETQPNKDGTQRVTGFSGSLTPIEKMLAEFGDKDKKPAAPKSPLFDSLSKDKDKSLEAK